MFFLDVFFRRGLAFDDTHLYKKWDVSYTA
jgi:hypothetical protein